MNGERRKALTQTMIRLDGVRGDLSLIIEDERDAFYNLPDGLQVSERGDRMNEAIDELDTACGLIDEAIGSINNAINA